MRRQRQYRSREARVVVAVFFPPVADDNEVADEAGCGRGRFGKAQPQLVAGVHDHVPIVDGGDEIAHVAEARVVALEVAPSWRSASQLVTRTFRRAPIMLFGDRVSAVAQLG